MSISTAFIIGSINLFILGLSIDYLIQKVAARLARVNQTLGRRAFQAQQVQRKASQARGAHA